MFLVVCKISSRYKNPKFKGVEIEKYEDYSGSFIAVREIKVIPKVNKQEKIINCNFIIFLTFLGIRWKGKKNKKIFIANFLKQK